MPWATTRSARRCYEEALALYVDSLTTGVAASLNNLGLLALREGDTARARDHLVASLDRFRRLDDRWAIGDCLESQRNRRDEQRTSPPRDLFAESLGHRPGSRRPDGVARPDVARQRGEPDR
jgi:hypothetical protein